MVKRNLWFSFFTSSEPKAGYRTIRWFNSFNCFYHLAAIFLLPGKFVLQLNWHNIGDDKSVSIRKIWSRCQFVGTTMQLMHPPTWIGSDLATQSDGSLGEKAKPHQRSAEHILPSNCVIVCNAFNLLAVGVHWHKRTSTRQLGKQLRDISDTKHFDLFLSHF